MTSQLLQVPGVGQHLAGSVPVVFIHGISSSWAMWEPSSATSIAGQAARIKGVTVWTFDYAYHSLDWVRDPAIGPAFADAISCLSRASGHKVIVVAHSMGGLATQYAIGYPGSPAAGDVAELITIGTPYQGSPLLSHMQKVVSGSEGVSAAGADLAYVVTAEALLSACAGVATHTDSNPCWLVSVLRSPVGTALEENSPDIKGLPSWPNDLPVLDTAGDISKVQVFTVSFTAIGDGAVSLASATGHDTTGQPVVQHCPAETIVQFAFHPGPCFHTHLPNDPKIINAILGAIRADVLTAGTASCPTAAVIEQALAAQWSSWRSGYTVPAWTITCAGPYVEAGWLETPQNPQVGARLLLEQETSGLKLLYGGSGPLCTTTAANAVPGMPIVPPEYGHALNCMN
jgi:pimeloyl-ACP methyl ester carboxylesterase